MDISTGLHLKAPQPTEIKRPRGSRAARLAVLLLLSILTAGGIEAYRHAALPLRTAHQVRAAFEEIAHLQPRISVKDRVVYEQTTSTLQLAVATRKSVVEREVEHEWLGSTKRIRLRGTYNIRAGFDLTKPVSVRIDGNKVSIEMPPPTILSVDQESVELLESKDGLWNRLKPGDVVDEVATLPLMARKKAVEGGLESEALARFEEQLEQRLGLSYTLEVNGKLIGAAPFSGQQK